MIQKTYIKGLERIIKAYKMSQMKEKDKENEKIETVGFKKNIVTDFT
jgi:hypothetical protein